MPSTLRRGENLESFSTNDSVCVCGLGSIWHHRAGDPAGQILLWVKGLCGVCRRWTGAWLATLLAPTALVPRVR